MKSIVRLALLASTLALFASTVCDTGALARGGGGRGFGGGGFGGGFAGDRGFGGDGGMRDGDFGRLDPSYYRGGRADAPYGGDSGAARPDAFTNAAGRVSDTDLRAAADNTYNWGNGRSLSTDGGLGRLGTSNWSNDHVTNRMNDLDYANVGNAVRDHYGYGNVFTRNWWMDHHGYWAYGDWPMAWAWGGCGWGDLAGWWGMDAATEPVDYDYGNNITYQNDNVYYGSQPEESAAAYYNDAQNLAQTGYSVATSNAPVTQSEWKPLGVYSLVQGSQTNTTMMFQLAVNKAGVIKGTYYNALTGEVKPVAGAVDKKRGRVAWTVGTDKTVVYDTGLSNLLKSQSACLVHYNKNKTQQWTLVKLKESQATG